jgi:hypothetical protein
MKPITSSVLLGCALTFAACGPSGRDGGGGGDDTGGGPDANGSNDPGTAQKCNKMDIVFVVDDSGSMSEEQSNLASNFPMFATVLQNFVNENGEHIDFRIGVTTTGKDFTTTFTGFPLPPMTEHGPDGVFMNNCGLAQRWLDSTTPNLGTTLGCRANVGTGGSSYEMPLLMAKHALDKHGSMENAGFLRPDALLGVVMLTDEDDGSSSADSIMIDPTDAVQFFDTLKGHRSRWAAGVIAGETACSSTFGNATEATRLKQFVQLTNANGSQQAVFSSICAGNLTMALSDVLAKFQSACGGIIL